MSKGKVSSPQDARPKDECPCQQRPLSFPKKEWYAMHLACSIINSRALVCLLLQLVWCDRVKVCFGCCRALGGHNGIDNGRSERAACTATYKHVIR